MNVRGRSLFLVNQFSNFKTESEESNVKIYLKKKDGGYEVYWVPSVAPECRGLWVMTVESSQGLWVMTVQCTESY